MTDVAKIWFTLKSLCTAVVMVAVFVGLLTLAGRPIWCKSGPGIWAAAFTHCTSQHLLDAYSLSHLLHGVIFYWLLRPLAGKVPLHWRLIAALGLEIGWELIENSPWVIAYYRQETAALDYTGDSLLNSLGDVFTCVLGFVIASRVSWKFAVVLYVVFELLALYLVRDNLTLNILMFLCPLDAIKEWQLQGMP